MAKTVLITGASSGIGAAFAEVAAKNGNDVVLVARREEKLKELSARLESTYHVKAFVFVSDLTQPNEPKRVWDDVIKQCGHIDILINNAGYGDFGPFQNSDADRNANMIALNCQVLVQLSNYASADMVKRGQGKICNIASVASFTPGPYMATYHATKAFVLNFSQSLATELRPLGVSVTAVCPGATRSEFEDHAHLKGKGIFDSKRHLPSSMELAEYGWAAIMRDQTVAIHKVSHRVAIAVTRFLPWQTVAHYAYRIHNGQNKK